VRTWQAALALLVAANVVLALVLFLLRSPAGSIEAVRVPPYQLPAQIVTLQDRIVEGPSGEPYALNLTDDELTAAVGYFVARAPDVPFTRLRVAVIGDRILVDGVTKGLAVTVPVQATVSLSTENGLPQAHIEAVSLGGVILPSFVQDQVLRQANASLDLSRYPMPITVDGIEQRPGGLTIRGTLK
jgi:hypothetical protein